MNSFNLGHVFQSRPPAHGRILASRGVPGVRTDRTLGGPLSIQFGILAQFGEVQVFLGLLLVTLLAPMAPLELGDCPNPFAYRMVIYRTEIALLCRVEYRRDLTYL